MSDLSILMYFASYLVLYIMLVLGQMWIKSFVWLSIVFWITSAVLILLIPWIFGVV